MKRERKKHNFTENFFTLPRVIFARHDLDIIHITQTVYSVNDEFCDSCLLDFFILSY